MDVASATRRWSRCASGSTQILYVDYLSYHRIDGDWLITSKAFHVEGPVAFGPVDGPRAELFHVRTWGGSRSACVGGDWIQLGGSSP